MKTLIDSKHFFFHFIYYYIYVVRYPLYVIVYIQLKFSVTDEDSNVNGFARYSYIIGSDFSYTILLYRTIRGVRAKS